MSAPLGLAQILYYNSEGPENYDSPTWAKVPIVKDCKVPNSKAEADSSCRGSGGVETKEPALRTVSFEFNVIGDAANAAFIFLRNAYNNNTLIDVWASDYEFDDEENTPAGPRIVGKVFKFDKGEPINDVVTYDVVIKPSYTSDLVNTPPFAYFSIES
jgi:hypothetical protein